MRSTPLLPLLAILSVVVSCATPSPAPPGDPASSPPASDPPAIASAPVASSPPAHCWQTEEEVTLAAGGEQPGAHRVLRLWFEEEAGKVVHETLRAGAVGTAPPQLYTVTWAVDGESFALTDADGRMSGSGTLVGEPWSWTGWTASSRLDSGIRIEEQATIGADGSLILGREVFGPDGRAVMTFHEEGRPLSAEECEERFVDARPHNPPARPE